MIFIAQPLARLDSFYSFLHGGPSGRPLIVVPVPPPARVPRGPGQIGTTVVLVDAPSVFLGGVRGVVVAGDDVGLVAGGSPPVPLWT